MTSERNAEDLGKERETGELEKMGQFLVPDLATQRWLRMYL